MLDKPQLEEFLRDYWTRKTFLARLSEEDFRSLKQELAGFDPVTLISEHKGEVASVWFEDGDGHAQAVDMSPADALKFYQAGMTVFLPDVKTPTIARWQVELARPLARPPRNFLTSLFISKNGNVSGCHFDHIENFTVQLRGWKTWRVMENPHAPLPTVNYSARTARPYLEDLWLYGRRPLPAQANDDAQRVTVTPGSMLYVPRGYWHEVEAGTDSISLLIAFPAYTWLDLVLPSLRTILLRRMEWRENAVYPYDDESWRTAHHRLSHLFRQLASFLEELDPAELLPHAPGQTNCSEDANATFLRNPLCTLGIYPAGDDRIDLVASVHQGDLSRTREAQVPATWRPALEMVDRSSQITQAALVHEHAELAVHLPRILEMLVALELIRPAATAAPDAAKLESAS